MLTRKMPFIHPGITLRDEVIKPSEHTLMEAADIFSLHPRDFMDICEGKAPITEALAEKIAATYGGFPDIWVKLQKAYDNDKARLNQTSNDL